MNRRPSRLARLVVVRDLEEQRARQDLSLAHAALRDALRRREAAESAVSALLRDGVRELAEFRTELQLCDLRSARMRAQQEQVAEAEADVEQAHLVWSAAARRVQGLVKLVERQREEQRTDELLAEGREHSDIYLARWVGAR